ncbi:MAG: site-specific integrase [Proteobacteria bacterium]|nr:site-specific integrase [Pseudomonadota bacterium]
MSVYKMADGRWLVQHLKGKDPARPNANKKYFGRGEAGEKAAMEFNASLGLGAGSSKRVQKSPQFVELVNAYIKARENIIAKSSLENLIIKMQGVILPALGDLMAHQISTTCLDDYVATRAAVVKKTTVHRELSDIRAVLKWAASRRLITSNPMAGYEMPRRDDARIRPPSKAEFEAILTCAVPHMKRAMLISWHTGLRPGLEELLRLTWDDVDMIGQTIMVTSADKGGLASRMVPINSVFAAHLAAWYEEDKKGVTRHLVHYHGGPVASLKTAWRMAKTRARVTRRLRMYDIRHAFITDLLEAGADLKSVSEIVGHSSPDMTMGIYQHVSSDLKKKAVGLRE